jgi:hypothetical protein
MVNASERIPPELSKELRKLAHDLSNALETIVQATYLGGVDRSGLAGCGQDQSEIARDLAFAELSRFRNRNCHPNGMKDL